MRRPVVTADQCAHVALGGIRPVGVRRVAQREVRAVRAAAQSAWAAVVENHPGVGRCPGIVRQEGDFGEAAQHDQVAVPAWPDPDQRRTRPGVDQPAAGASVQHHQVAVDRIDQRGLADTVFTGEDGRHPGPVPRDQLGGARVHGVDAAGQPIVGVGGDHPDLGALRAFRGDLTRQPMPVGGMNDAGDRPVDRQFDITRRTGPPAPQETLDGPRVTAVVDEMGECRRIG